jgi:electron transfer flavoprotein beta subunit
LAKAMLVAVALRFSDHRASVDPLTGQARTDPRAGGAGAADLAALEHALRLRDHFRDYFREQLGDQLSDRRGVRCVAVTVGPAAADEMLRGALALGVDEVLRIDGPDPADTATEDGSETARLLLAGLPTPPDIVLCGDHSAERGTGATPAFLAHLLGAAQALGLVELTVEPGGGLRAVRRLDGGRRERLAFSAPAVCSVEPAGTVPRRASLPATLAARRATIPVVHVGSMKIRPGEVKPYRPRPRTLPASVPVPGGAGPHERILSLTGALTERTPPALLTPATPAEAAEALLGYLKEHGYLEEHGRAP